MLNPRCAYQSTVSDKLFKLCVFALVNFLFQDTQCHGFFNNVVVVGHMSFVNATMEES